MPSLEKCCGKCKTPWSVCARKRQCPCHLPAEYEDADMFGRTVIATPAPTPMAPLFQEPAS